MKKRERNINFFVLVGLSALFLFVNGCAQKLYTKQSGALIVFKTPLYQYADMGFVYEGKDEVKVEIYGSGQALTKFTIDRKNICMSLLECMSKGRFNEKILSEHYPANLLENIFRARPIFGGWALEKTRNGFTQKVIDPRKYHIEYEVLNKQAVFHDTMNSVTIKVKRTE